MRRESYAAIVAAVAVVLVGGFFLTGKKHDGGMQAVVIGDASTTASAVAAPRASAGQRFASTKSGYSFLVPSGYRAHALGTDSGGTDSVVVQGASGNGMQISVTPFDEKATDLTAARIHQDLPKMKISDAKTIPVASGISGLEFSSDNPAWNGSSRELWFVYKGRLYQLATYAKDASLLDTIWKSWRWTVT